ncbi:MAG: cation:proton antiporter [Chloroflexota bacterium]
MSDLSFIIDLSLALIFALAGGLVANRLRQPTILGYLAAGILLSPHTPWLTLHVENVEGVAELGIILLLFALGVELQLKELGRVRNVAIWGGTLQILATIAFGWLIGQALGYSPAVAFFFGALIAISSTVVVVRVLQERGELDSTHGRVMLGICLVQDLSLVVLLALLPALGGQTENVLLEALLAIGKAALILAATYLLGARVVPLILFRVAATRSRELFIITIVCLALGTAAAVSAMGLSLELGAFLAGIVVSESEFSHQGLADVLPLRDLFAVLFFVSIGMNVEPAYLMRAWPTVLATVAAVLVVKFLIVALVVRGFGYAARTAIYAGAGMLQIGEFSFVLASIGVAEGTLPPDVFSLTLAAALLTIMLTPLTMRLAEPALAALLRVQQLAPWLKEPVQAYLEGHEQALQGHAVIVGYGNAGQLLCNVLAGRRYPVLVVDSDSRAIALARQKGLPCLYGDAANPHVQEQLNLPRARFLAVTSPDAIATQLMVTNALRINPRLDVVVRAPGPDALRLLHDVGARLVINPAQEVALEMTRHALHRFGVSSIEALAVVNRLRMESTGEAQ